MFKVKGDLALMSLEEILRGCENHRKSGLLRIGRGEVKKLFCLREGDVIFVTSNAPGERFGEFLSSRGCLDLSRVRSLLAESRKQGVPFTADLLEAGVFQRGELEEALRQLILIALADSLRWEDGIFQLEGRLPQEVLKGPIQIAVAGALDQALHLNASMADAQSA